MAIEYRNQNFLDFQEFIQGNSYNRMAGADSTPLYAHPVDQWILKALNATPVKAIMNRALDALVSWEFGHELASSVFIDQKSFPDLFEVLAQCSKTLGIPMPHAVATSAGASFNAHAAGTDEYAFINISAALCQFYTKEEASFVIGHECGHIASNHMAYYTLVQVLTRAATLRLGYIGFILRLTAGVPLLAWSRRAEVTCDRAGLLCCSDIKIAERALLRLVTGLADVDRVDIEDYLQRSKGMEEFHRTSEFKGLFDSHPQIPKRIEALRLFANSELYYELSGQPHPEGKVLLTRAELDRRVNQIVQP